MARILVIGNYKKDHQESMTRYTDWLINCYRSSGHHVDLIRPVCLFGRIHTNRPSAKKWVGYIDKYIVFPWILLLGKYYDCVHITDHSNAVYLPFARSREKIITCHDVLAIRAARGEITDAPVGLLGKLLQRSIFLTLRTSNNIIFVSNETCDQFLEMVPRHQGRRWIIDNPLNWPYRPLSHNVAQEVLSAHEINISAKFFCHVGGNQWYKNRAGVIKLFLELRKRDLFSNHLLVMVGKPFDAKAIEACTAAPEGTVVLMTGISNQVLNALYCLTEGLLFPSLAEGFGWPIVEAQSCNCLVITSDREPMRSVASSGAILIDPTDYKSAAQKIESHWEARHRLISLGKSNSRRFEAQIAAKKYLSAIYETLQLTS